MLNLEKLLDVKNDENDMKTLQGNILQSHGREHAAHLFLRFDEGRRDAVAEWISDFAKSADNALQEWQLHKNIHDKVLRVKGLFSMILLSANGYRGLGLEDDSLPKDRHFQDGMKKYRRQEDLEDWDKAYREDIDALVILADDNRSRLYNQVEKITAALKGTAKIVAVESGDALRPPGKEYRIEHFGFRDGISQPIFIEQRLASRTAAHWNPATPLDVLLEREEGGSQEDRFGSYMVFQKLEQDVAGFRRRAEEIAAKLLQLDSSSEQTLEAARERIEALAIGREKDGTPLVPESKEGETDAASLNAFDFRNDIDGDRCPFHAHIRKVNPRGQRKIDYVNVRRIDSDKIDKAFDEGQEEEKSFRIARRGITYGERTDLKGSTDQPPDGGVGLLFMSVQSDISKFLFQDNAASSKNYLRTGTGVDAVIGRTERDVPQKWSLAAKGTETKEQLANYVTLKGGEYFFAPSVPFLEELRNKVGQSRGNATSKPNFQGRPGSD